MGDNKNLVNILLFVDSTLLAVIGFLFYLRAPMELGFLTLCIFLLMLVTISELVNERAGIYIVIVSIFLILFKAALFSADPKNDYLMALGYLIIFIYYFLVRFLRTKRFEKTHAREKHFRSLVNVSPQPMIIKNAKAEVIFASNSLKELLGLKKNLPIGKNISDYIHPDDIHLYDKFLSQVLEEPGEKKSIELRLRKNNGWIWAKNDALNLLNHRDVKAIVSSWQDITFQKTVDLQKAELLKNERDARAMAEKAVHDRDEFLSIASHELKTPLTTVLLQLQATLRKILTQSLADFSGKDLLASLQIAEKQSQSLSVLIKDLLNVSIASTGRLTLNKERVNLSKLVEELSEKYSEEIRLSRCKVKTIIKDQQIIGNWDPVRLEQALTNLLTNALKYAKGKNVVMSVEKSGDFALFKIDDTGDGIPPEKLNRIFEPFQRANSHASTKGLGVGLFITRQIANSHGGDISVTSKVGKGTTFTLTLPI